MNSESSLEYLSIDQLCAATNAPHEVIIAIVDHGIVDPGGDAPDSWAFTTKMVTVTKKACRLHRDLEIDWPGIALALDLIDELEQLRDQNRQLQSRLSRFITPS